MSFFDAMFASYGAPVLMDKMATPGVATIIFADGRTLCDVTAIVRHENDVDAVEDMTETKRFEKEVDFSSDDSLVWKGLSAPMTNAQVLLKLPGCKGQGELWEILEVRNRTTAFIRVVLTREIARAEYRSGYYQQGE